MLLPLPVNAGRALVYTPASVLRAQLDSDPPALVLTIDDGVPHGQMVGAGDEVHYTLVFTNVGSANVSNVRLVAAIPPHTQVISQTLQGWSCNSDGTGRAPQTCTLAVGLLAAGANHSAEFGLVLDDPLPADMTLVTLDAAVIGDEVVCGECGLATIDTPVDPRSNAQGDAYRIFFPAVSQRS
jgi:uncharacterized repeat protein (TIGR01451 family)